MALRNILQVLYFNVYFWLYKSWNLNLQNMQKYEPENSDYDIMLVMHCILFSTHYLMLVIKSSISKQEPCKQWLA